MDPALLEILCCPLTHQALREADAGVLARAGELTGRSFAAGLLRADGLVFYPVIDGIAHLAPEEAVPLTPGI